MNINNIEYTLANFAVNSTSIDDALLVLIFDYQDGDRQGKYQIELPFDISMFDGNTIDGDKAYEVLSNFIDSQ